MEDTTMEKKGSFFQKDKERINKRNEKEKSFFRGKKKKKDERERGPEKRRK